MKNSKALVIVSSSEQQTEALGKAVGEKAFAGLVVALTGDLGSGKTVFARGMARGLGIDYAPITSPSFVLVNRYDGRLPFFHIDLYRLEDAFEVHELGIDDMIREGVLAVEWAEKFDGVLPEERMSVRLEFVSDTERRITIAARGERELEILWSLKG